MEGLFFNTKSRDYLLESCVDGKISDSENHPQPSAPLSTEKHVRFSRTQVYYFNRQQGHSSVPQRGGCSLGMASMHFHSEVHSEAAFRKMRRDEKKLSLANNIAVSAQLSGRGRKRKYSQCIATVASPGKCFIPTEKEFSPGDDRRVPTYFSPTKLSSRGHDSIEPEGFSTVNAKAPSPQRASTGFDVPETDSDISLESISTAKTYNRKLLPLPPMVRTRLLKRAGVSNIDDSERLSCAWLRSSRVSVGCGCLSTSCDPETCSCALSSVPCQVDRPGFPCNCSSQCRNPNGRVEFSSSRVRAHVIHVLQRLANGKERPELSSDRGECLQCLHERFSLPLPVSPSPPVSPDPTIPSSLPLLVDGLCEIPPMISVNMSAIVATSTPVSKAIVLYTPPSIIQPSCEMTEVSLEKQRFLLSTPPAINNHSEVDIVVVGDAAKSEPDLEVLREPGIDDETFLQAKAIFPQASSTNQSPTSSKTPAEESIESLQPSTPISKSNSTSILDRLSLRKRRIIRSPCPQPFRKRFEPARHAASLIIPPPTLASLAELDSPLRSSTRSLGHSALTSSSTLQPEDT